MHGSCNTNRSRTLSSFKTDIHWESNPGPLSSFSLINQNLAFNRNNDLIMDKYYYSIIITIDNNSVINHSRKLSNINLSFIRGITVSNSLVCYCEFSGRVSLNIYNITIIYI